VEPHHCRPQEKHLQGECKQNGNTNHPRRKKKQSRFKGSSSAVVDFFTLQLAQGEYIAPERIENILTARCNLIMQIYIHKVRAAYLKELEIAGKAGGLRGFELAKRVHLTLDVFSVDNNMVTPTGKVRRPTTLRNRFV